MHFYSAWWAGGFLLFCQFSGHFLKDASPSCGVLVFVSRYIFLLILSVAVNLQTQPPCYSKGGKVQAYIYFTYEPKLIKIGIYIALPGRVKLIVLQKHIYFLPCCSKPNISLMYLYITYLWMYYYRPLCGSEQCIHGNSLIPQFCYEGVHNLYSLCNTL